MRKNRRALIHSKSSRVCFVPGRTEHARLPAACAGSPKSRKRDRWLHRQCVEIGEVRHVRQRDHADAQRTIWAGGERCAPVFHRHAVFFFETQVMQMRESRQRTEMPEALFHHLHSRAQQPGIAAEFIDREAADTRAVRVVKQLERAEQRSEHAAAIDIANQQTLGVGRVGHGAY